MSRRLQAVRGMHDILPEDTPRWRALERVLATLFARYGLRELRTPIVEHTELFARSIGEQTDIVEKEMYTFDDRNGDSLTLRPEGTASCVRAGVQHGLLHNQVQRLWYLGPMFRHERPQAGRYRQFHQAGVEVFGLPGPDVDAEVIALGARLWRELGVEGLRLELNTLGTPAARARYRERLVRYLGARRDALDADSLRRLERNPLRILDSKNPQLAEVIAGAPSLHDDLDDESRAHFDTLRELLAAIGIPFEVNPRLVRGLDYYTRTVFEWVSDRLGAQGTVCAGGRYDGLVERLGGRPTPAIGFAIGLERLLELAGSLPGAASDQAHACVLALEPPCAGPALALTERLRERWPRLRVLVDAAPGSIRSRFRRADRSGALIALVLGPDELATDEVTVKPLRAMQRGQQRMPRAEVVEALPRLLAAAGDGDGSGAAGAPL